MENQFNSKPGKNMSIDYGDYKIIDGKLNVSDAPGFGMKLMI